MLPLYEQHRLPDGTWWSSVFVADRDVGFVGNGATKKAADQQAALTWIQQRPVAAPTSSPPPPPPDQEPGPY